MIKNQIDVNQNTSLELVKHSKEETLSFSIHTYKYEELSTRHTIYLTKEELNNVIKQLQKFSSLVEIDSKE